jgi:hypothetical protein
MTRDVINVATKLTDAGSEEDRMISHRTVTKEEWIADAERRFGKDQMAWRFVCPSCGHVATPADWKNAKAPEGTVAFSCIGRWTGADDSKTFKKAGGPCIYAGGGLFKINPVTVIDEDGREHELFDFAPRPS